VFLKIQAEGAGECGDSQPGPAPAQELAQEHESQHGPADIHEGFPAGGLAPPGGGHPFRDPGLLGGLGEAA
jgi:hypothetical protein